MLRHRLSIGAIALVAFFLTAAGSLAPADDPKPKEEEKEIKIVGRYQVEGIAPNEAKYASLLTIRAKGDAFSLIWSGPGAQTLSSGVGIRKGNLLATSWIVHGPVPLTGVMVYKISEGPKLEAEWAIHPTDGKLYKEVCVKEED